MALSWRRTARGAPLIAGRWRVEREVGTHRYVVLRDGVEVARADSQAVALSVAERMAVGATQSE